MEYKILVADDDKEIREAIEIYLTNEQMKVLTACDGQEALKVLEANLCPCPPVPIKGFT